MANALWKSTMLPKDFQNNVPHRLVLLDLASRFKHMGISPSPSGLSPSALADG